MIGLPAANSFVLQRTPYRENSQLLRLLTTDYGQVTVIYRATEPVYLYQPYHVVWSGRPESPVLRSIEVAGKVLRLQGETTYLALYLNELTGVLLPRGVPAESLVGSYYATLKGLQMDEPAEPLLRFFELRLLAQLGFGLDLQVDTLGEALQSDRSYCFDGVNRFVPLNSGRAVAMAGDATTTSVSGASLLAMARHDFSVDQTCVDAKRVLRQALQYHLGDRKLQSRQLFGHWTPAGANQNSTGQDTV